MRCVSQTEGERGTLSRVAFAPVVSYSASEARPRNGKKNKRTETGGGGRKKKNLLIFPYFTFKAHPSLVLRGSYIVTFNGGRGGGREGVEEEEKGKERKIEPRRKILPQFSRDERLTP